MIDKLLSALLAAIDGVVEAADNEDQEKVELYSGHVRAMMWKITAQWAEMEGALVRAEQTIRNLGSGDLTGDPQAIALEEARNLRNVIAKVKEE
jgi:hypothetical protein